MSYSEWRAERRRRRTTQSRERLRAARSAARPRIPRDADGYPDWLCAFLVGGAAAVEQLQRRAAAEERESE